MEVPGELQAALREESRRVALRTNGVGGGPAGLHPRQPRSAAPAARMAGGGRPGDPGQVLHQRRDGGEDVGPAGLYAPSRDGWWDGWSEEYGQDGPPSWRTAGNGHGHGHGSAGRAWASDGCRSAAAGRADDGKSRRTARTTGRALQSRPASSGSSGNASSAWAGAAAARTSAGCEGGAAASTLAGRRVQSQPSTTAARGQQSSPTSATRCCESKPTTAASWCRKSKPTAATAWLVPTSSEVINCL